MSSKRLFRNVPFFWKISGSFLICLLIVFFIIRYLLCITFEDVENDMKANVFVETQRETDLALSIARTVLERRKATVALTCAMNVHEINDAVQSGSSIKSIKLETFSVDTEMVCSFFILLDSKGVVVQGVAGNSGSFESRTNSFTRRIADGRPVSLADWELFELAEHTDLVSGVSIISGEVISLLNLWPPDITAETLESLNKEALVATAVSKIKSKGSPYFLVAGYLLDFDRQLLPEAAKISSRYSQTSDGSKILVKPVFSLFQGDRRVASTVIGKDGKNAVGTSMKLPETSVGESSEQIWRKRTLVKGNTYVSAYCPILGKNGRILGYIGSGVDVRSVMAVRTELFQAFRTRTGKHLAITLVLSLALALFIGVSIARMLSNPLITLTEFTSEVASGNLTVKVPFDGEDEIGVFAEGFRNMILNLSNLVRSIEKATIELDSASGELNANISMQTATTSQQSAAVNETTATLEELAASSKQIAESSLAVVRLAAKTLESAKDGVTSSTETIDLMSAIRQAGMDDISKIATLSSRVARIDEIMRLINAIADQTKLIAFNAAIEAAAAGEAGHRFNVVSEEIRRLADNVQDKGREIRASISDVQESARALDESCREDSNVIESGVTVTERTSKELEEILRDSEGVLIDSKKISMATQEQRLATEQTLTAIREINKAVTELANGMKSSEGVASRLAILARDLAGTVSCFELDEPDEDSPEDETSPRKSRLCTGVK